MLFYAQTINEITRKLLPEQITRIGQVEDYNKGQYTVIILS